MFARGTTYILDVCFYTFGMAEGGNCSHDIECFPQGQGHSAEVGGRAGEEADNERDDSIDSLYSISQD